MNTMKTTIRVIAFGFAAALMAGCASGDEAREEVPVASAAAALEGGGCWVTLHGCSEGGMACSTNGKCTDEQRDKVCDALIAKTCGIPWPPREEASEMTLAE